MGHHTIVGGAIVQGGIVIEPLKLVEFSYSYTIITQPEAAVVQRCSVKKLQTEACNFIKKEILAQVFSCEFCEIFKNRSSHPEVFL